MPPRHARCHPVRMYEHHMDGWWAWTWLMPVVVIATLAAAVYLAVRLGVRDGKRR